MSLAWEHCILSYQERQDLMAVLPAWDGEHRPPQPDWYVALELASDLNVNIFRLERLPMREPFLTVVKGWALLRREANARAAQITAAGQATEAHLFRHR